jgi:formylglycine-generating enzyme required for sulfatase activity
MVLLASAGVCIDRYEASHGTGGAAASVAGAEPWVDVDWPGASAACTAAGKRLCEADEWLEACQGPSGREFPYGDSFVRGRCHDASFGSEAAFATGSFLECEGGYGGLFDVAGNVWEWTAACPGGRCELRGGSFRNGERDMRCTAADDSGRSYTAHNVGFRCCFTP